ncbi:MULTISPECIES: hypothetical protein [unclassified Sedimentibacter]|uniref:hypothetical protein n=1 Tax=unclassified Sedimentibacter TaxID=2649220 RepID=UPI0027E05EE3|nr:hypothetical protein [Sedimentibacter sp. MB35-C1]WMJ76849.1 hypothetical protein RBQ61_14910 [Sedimentibacter sp. MB35-C1]
MACFLVPAAEAVVITVIKKSVKKKEISKINLKSDDGVPDIKTETGLSWSRKLNWLTNLLWGGVFLLAIEHIWHGEVVLRPPFLTAMNNPENIAPMLHEIATVGVSMAIFVTAIWSVMVLVSDYLYKTTAAFKHAMGEE